MAVCDFNMCFTFVLAGWEGTAHDTRIFNEALQRLDYKFPYPSGGWYNFFSDTSFMFFKLRITNVCFIYR